MLQKEKGSLGTILSTLPRKQSFGFIPLHFQRVMQSVSHVTPINVKGSHTDKMKYLGISIQAS